MRTIHKYVLGADPAYIISTHSGFRPLTVQLQNGEPTLWCEVDDDALRINRSIYVVGTGHQVPLRCAYIGTVQIGGYVWHYYLEVA